MCGMCCRSLNLHLSGLQRCGQPGEMEDDDSYGSAWDTQDDGL